MCAIFSQPFHCLQILCHLTELRALSATDWMHHCSSVDMGLHAISSCCLAAASRGLPFVRLKVYAHSRLSQSHIQSTCHVTRHTSHVTRRRQRRQLAAPLVTSAQCQLRVGRSEWCVHPSSAALDFVSSRSCWALFCGSSQR